MSLFTWRLHDKESRGDSTANSSRTLMEAILVERYAFCNFSKIDGFPNPMPDRREWDISLLQFSGSDWEMPAEFLWDFHDWIHRLHFVHEDVKIKLFRFSLKGATLDYCRNLPS